MKIHYCVGNFCKKVYDKINNPKFAEVSKMRKEDFTRNRKVGFVGTMLIVLNKTGKGISSAIRTYREAVKTEEEKYSKQAFSKGRMRIKWEAFREIFRMSVEEFYKDFPHENYKGFRLSAVDGTKINLPYNEETKTEFGCQKSSGEQIQSLGSCLYDVLNGILIDAVPAPSDSNERKLAETHMEYLDKIRTEKELILFDRGYPSSELMDFIDKKGFKYLMRADETFTRGFIRRVDGIDSVITHTFANTKLELTFRFIQLSLKDNEGNDVKELLITNVFDDIFDIKDFEKLYHLRWGIETKYNDIKNKLQIESFSGTSPLAIKQDFYATMFLNNLASMMIIENKEEIDRIHNSKENKYQYKANVNAVISLLKESVVEMLYTDSSYKKKKLLKKIYSEIQRAVVPVRPGRSFARNKAHKSSKFPQNQRS